MKIVLADDLTGAAEIAGIAWQAGYRVAVQTTLDTAIDAELVVIDTDTRSKSSEAAARIITNLVQRIARMDAVLLYKKTDSALRGHIALELDVILRHTDFEKVLFIPANPSLGRTISGGRYFVNGVPINETDFARDPEFPINSPYVTDTIGSNPKTVVPDIGDVADVRELASQVGGTTLGAGGGDFFAAILSARHGAAETKSTLVLKHLKKKLVVQGSKSEYSQQFFNQAEANGSARILVPSQLILTAEDDDSAPRIWIESVKQKMQLHDVVVLKIENYLTGITPSLVARRLAHLLGDVLESTKYPVDVFIEGGSTASALFQRLGVSTLAVVGVHQRGIVSLQDVGGEGRIFTVKPGSYAWPEGLFIT